MSVWDWLLEVEGAGPVRRWSTGSSYDVASGSRVLRFVRALSPLELAPGDDDIQIEVYDPDTDWPAIAGDLGHATVRLWRWEVGTELGAAQLFARGRAVELSHGGRFELATFAIRQERQATWRDMPDPLSTVSSATWPISASMHLYEPDEARYYPIVFGWPGYWPGAPDDCYPCVPCPLGQFPDDLTTLALYYEPWNIVSEDPTTTSPTQVVVRGPSDEEQRVEGATVERDLRGRSIVAVNYQLDVYGFPSEGEEQLVGYTPAGDASPMRDMYSVIAYVLGRWARDTVDWARMREVRAYLERFKVDTWIDERVEGGPWEWVAGLIRDLQLKIRTGARGRYLELQRTRPDPTRTRRAVVVGEGCSRLTPISYVGEPFSRALVRFGDVRWKDGPVGRVAYVPAPAAYSWERAHGTLSASEARYGRRDVEVDLPWTFDTQTARLVAEDIIAAEALPYRIVSLAVPESWRLGSQDQIEITDEDAGLDGVLGIITDPPVVGGALATIQVRLP